MKNFSEITVSLISISEKTNKSTSNRFYSTLANANKKKPDISNCVSNRGDNKKIKNLLFLVKSAKFKKLNFEKKNFFKTKFLTFVAKKTFTKI